MIRNKFVILCLSFVISIFPIHKLSNVIDQDQVATFNVDKGFGDIDIQGEINSHTADVAKEGFKIFEEKGFKKVVIHLNSPGGDVDAGADIIKEMLTAENNYNMTVTAYVDHREFCASMCTAIFGSANFRVAAWDSRWAFHSPYVVLTDSEKNDPYIQKESQEELAQDRKFLLSVYESVDPDWTNKVLKKYVMSPTRTLRLTGAQIIDQSPWWIDYVLEDDLTGKI